ncbi:fungal pheromone STE3G-protein-coupled receptor, partial [Fistulina hepatica ATCC 64428]
MKYPELPLFAFLTAFLVLIPIPWHWRARNVATLSIIAWLFVVNFIYGVNALLWADNVEIKAVVWCDIATKIVVGASFALPLGTLCVCKHLEAISSTRHVHVDLKRRMIFEGVMCFGIPMVFMALHYIVQGHRFDIVEDIGCSATIYFSIPAILIIWFPQLLFATITFIYAAIAIHHFVQRRAVLAFRAGASGLTASRYIRLIAMSVTEMAWVTAFSALNLWSNVTATGLRPYTSWAYVHSDFSRIDNEYIRALIPDWYWRRIMLFWWLMPASAIIFFLFFGFGQEATKEYRRVW